MLNANFFKENPEVYDKCVELMKAPNTRKGFAAMKEFLLAANENKVKEYCCRIITGDASAEAETYFSTKVIEAFFIKHEGAFIIDNCRCVCQPTSNGGMGIYLELSKAKTAKWSNAQLLILQKTGNLSKQINSQNVTLISSVTLLTKEQCRSPFADVVSELDTNLKSFLKKLHDIETLL